MSKLYDLVVINLYADAMVVRIPAAFQKYWKDFFNCHQGTWTVKAFKVKDYVGNLEKIPPASNYITKSALTRIWLDIQYERVDCFFYSEFVALCEDAQEASKIFNVWKRANPKAIKNGADKQDSDCIMFGNN